MTNTRTEPASDEIKGDATSTISGEATSKIDARTDALVAELRAMREKVAEVMGQTHAPADAKVRAA